ncbi:UNVERIFIED_ORG: putative transposase [Xanthobacter viscosus]
MAILDHGQKQRTRDALLSGLTTPDRIQKQIIGMLKEQEAGAKTADVCRKHGISSATFYKFKAKYGGMDVSDARRLKALEEENARLKKLLAEQMLDNAILKDVSAKKW